MISPNSGKEILPVDADAYRALAEIVEQMLVSERM